MPKISTPDMPEPKTMMHLQGDHADALEGANVGDVVPMEVHGKVTSVSQHDGNEGEGPRRNVSVEVHKVKHKKPGNKGRAGGKDADMQEGGKAAMDAALSEEASAEDAE